MATHLPVDLNDARARGWDELDIVLITGDSHLDHPSFPAALLGRWLEAHGFRVGVIARPDPNRPDSIASLGLPRLFFGVTSGALDSMVANYTALKRRRSDDPYAPGGQAGGRPDRALTVYCNLIRRHFGKSAFIVAGGLEASMRRFAHFDFWTDRIRRPILMDCGADVLVHGMGERPVLDIARALANTPDARDRLAALRDVPGVVYRTPRSAPPPENGIALPGSEQVAADPQVYVTAHQLSRVHRNALLWQESGGMRIVHNPPPAPLTTEEMDKLYALPFTRDPHPTLRGNHVPALEQVRFSVTTHRGCFGGCSFCAIGMHQGKEISNRSPQSILAEVGQITRHPDFCGVINDVGGPSANFYGLGCSAATPCNRVSCLWPKPCTQLRQGSDQYLALLRAVRQQPGVKHVFVTTGIRTDETVLTSELIRELAFHHTSGLIKVAPEHVSSGVLAYMHKPNVAGFERFLELFRRYSAEANKEQYVIPYLMAAHPGTKLADMVEVYHFLKRHHLRVEQCQIFTPTPGTDATVMYATGLDPATRKPVFVERDPEQKRRQKALILYHLPENRTLIQSILGQEHTSSPGAKPRRPIRSGYDRSRRRR